MTFAHAMQVPQEHPPGRCRGANHWFQVGDRVMWYTGPIYRTTITGTIVEIEVIDCGGSKECDAQFQLCRLDVEYDVAKRHAPVRDEYNRKAWIPGNHLEIAPVSEGWKPWLP